MHALINCLKLSNRFLFFIFKKELKWDAQSTRKEPTTSCAHSLKNWGTFGDKTPVKSP